MAKPEGFSSTQQEEIVKQAISFWDAASTVMQPLFEAINDYNRLYRVVLPKELDDAYALHPDRSALAPTDVYNNIGALRAQIQNYLFSTKPYAQISKDGQPNLRDSNVEKAEQVLQSMLDMSDFANESDLAIQQVLIGGITAVFTQWVQKFERVPLRDKETYAIQIDDKTGEAIFNMELVSEYAETISLDIRHVRIDPSADRKKHIRIVGYESVIPLSELLIKNRDENSYYNFNEKDLIKSSFSKEEYYKYVSGEVDTYAGKGMENEDFGDKLVRVRDFRGIFRTVHKDGRYSFDDLIVIVGNDNIPLGIKKNDLPIKGWELFDFPIVDQEHGRLYPMGIVEPVMDSYVEKFIKKNQSIDEANRATYDRYIADKSATQDLPDIMEHAPEQVIKVDLFASGARSIHDVFAPLARQQHGQDTFQHSAVLTDEIQQTMKLNDYRQGSDPSRKETATAVDALVGGGQALLEKLVNSIKDSYLAPCWRKQLILYNFFKGHEENIVSDQQGQQVVINPGELNTYYKIDIDIATAVDRPGMTRRFVEMYNNMAQDPYFDAYEVRKAATEILKLPNPEKLLPSSELKQFIIDKENAALGYGLEMPIHPQENHQQHIEVHTQYIDFLKQQGQNPKVLMDHIEQHQEILDKQSKSIANTKGGNSGNLSNPESASIKQNAQV